ncbi:DUF6368 family protein [Streptomyces sp. NPDC050085]|uniref:DUF6368 family protein n=1 Tax=Streptomyces sp. NPDC050085 TaxID=3365600 RepID=UPI0037B7B007
MSGPVLVIELPKRPSPSVVEQLRAIAERVSTRCEQTRIGAYDLCVRAGSLGIVGAGDGSGPRPVLVSLLGPGVGDEATFASEHADVPGLREVIGFRPTHAIDVIAFCGRPVDHVVVALPAAALMDVTGGVAHAELDEAQWPLVAGLPGLRATTLVPWPAVFGSAAFLRAWAQAPGFRLLK